MNIWKPKWHSQSPNLKDYSNAVLAELLQIKTDQENHLEKSLEKAANMDIHKFWYTGHQIRKHWVEMFRRNKQKIIYLAQKDDESREKKTNKRSTNLLQSKLLFP